MPRMPLTSPPIIVEVRFCKGCMPAESAVPARLAARPRSTSSSPLPDMIAPFKAEVRLLPKLDERFSRSVKARSNALVSALTDTVTFSSVIIHLSGKARISVSSDWREGASKTGAKGPRAAFSSRGVIDQNACGESRSRPNPARITSSHGNGPGNVFCGGDFASAAALKGLAQNPFPAPRK